ncbi:MAG: hypothetical protein RMK32_09815 [Anaerolineae bacterium]|nr:hypothetical protein [Anaerolineae bacterium]MDW8065908.1 hypothetical protein [Anaerolineae bacterium]
MRGIFAWVVAGLLIALTACARPTPPASPTASPSPSPSPEPTSPATPAATPDLQRILFPTPEDWSKGAAEARVTFIEWGDFQ